MDFATARQHSPLPAEIRSTRALDSHFVWTKLCCTTPMKSEADLVVARTWVVAAAGVVGLPSGFTTNDQRHGFAEDQP